MGVGWACGGRGACEGRARGETDPDTTKQTMQTTQTTTRCGPAVPLGAGRGGRFPPVPCTRAAGRDAVAPPSTGFRAARTGCRRGRSGATTTQVPTVPHRFKIRKKPRRARGATGLAGRLDSVIRSHATRRSPARRWRRHALRTARTMTESILRSTTTTCPA